MIRIFKENDIKVVTNGVYNSLYKPLGYKPVIEEVKEEQVIQPKKEEVKPEKTKESSKTTKKKKEWQACFIE